VLLGAVTVLFIAGVVDDLRPMGAKTKFSAQVFAVCLLLAGQGFLEPSSSGIVGLLVIGFWLLSLINGVNLLDNMDGTAAGTSLISALCISLFALQLAEPDLAAVYLALSGAIAGFLMLNINPAKLFMGDAGSLWIGLMIGSGAISVSVINSSQSELITYWLWIPILICSVPLLDTTSVCITRTLRGQSIAQGGRDHLSHRLVARGFTERQSAAILWIVSAGGAAAAWQFIRLPPHQALSIAGLFGLFGIGFSLWLCLVPYQRLERKG